MGCQIFLRCLKINRVIRSTAIAAMTEMQGSPQAMARHADDGGRGLPYRLVIGEAAPAVDLIMWMIFEHLRTKFTTPCLLARVIY